MDSIRSVRPDRPFPPLRPFRTVLFCLLAAALPAQKPAKRPLPHLPPGHPAQVRTWHLAYEVTFHVKGSEAKQGEHYEQKLDFHSTVALTGEVDLVGPTTAMPPAGAAPKNAAELMKTMLRRVMWTSTLARPAPGKQPFAQHRHEVSYRVDDWSWLRTEAKPAGGEDTEWTSTDFERKVAGDGKAPLIVVAELVFDVEEQTYELVLGFTDDRQQQPLRVTSKRVVKSGDHNGTAAPETEERNGRLPLDQLVNGTCASDTWLGTRVYLRKRPLPEGSPESFVVDLEEPMTKVGDELCPVTLQTPAEWLAKNPKNATVHVTCTLTRKS